MGLACVAPVPRTGSDVTDTERDHNDAIAVADVALGWAKTRGLLPRRDVQSVGVTRHQDGWCVQRSLVAGGTWTLVVQQGRIVSAHEQEGTPADTIASVVAQLQTQLDAVPMLGTRCAGGKSARAAERSHSVETMQTPATDAVEHAIAWVVHRYGLARVQSTIRARVLVTTTEGALVQVMLCSSAYVTVWVTPLGMVLPAPDVATAARYAELDGALCAQCQAMEAELHQLLTTIEAM